jgi:hypothetical protein
MSCTICATAALALGQGGHDRADHAHRWLPASGNGTAAPPQRAPDGLKAPGCPPVRVGSLTAPLPGAPAIADRRWRMTDAIDELLAIEDADEDAAMSPLAAMVGLDPLEPLVEAVVDGLGPRERICSVGQLVHVAGTVCWCNDIPTPTLVEPVPRPDQVWLPWDAAMIAAGHYSPRPQVRLLEEAWAA